MDNAFLSPLADELRRDLVGSPLGDVIQIDSRRFALRFAVPPFERLSMDLHPEISAIHRVARAPTPRELTDLSRAFSGRLAGATLSALRKEPDERVIELDFSGGAEGPCTLVIELMGRASNLLLLDAERRIVRFLPAHGATLRNPREGEMYTPPPARDPAGPRLPWASRLLGREVAARASRGADPAEAHAELEARMADGVWAPVVYTPLPLAGMNASIETSPGTCFPAPFPLDCAGDLHAARFESFDEASRVWAELAKARLAHRDLRGSLAHVLRSECARMERLLRSLGEEAEAAQGAELVRRHAEMILASLGRARKVGDHVVLPDIYQPGSPEIRLPVDPRLDLRGNAEALFRKARKMERAVPAIERRLRETAARLGEVEAFRERLEEATSREDLEKLEGELNRSSVVRLARRPERKEAGRKPSFFRIREFQTSDGFTVVAGRSGRDNDTITFKMAAPHDFWLHAAGRAGAHVIVRNPRRVKALPEAALREAAALAAWLSRGDRETDVEVHYTRRKEVRKGKGMSPGMVMLRSFKSIKVRPALPGGASEP